MLELVINHVFRCILEPNSLSLVLFLNSKQAPANDNLFLQCIERQGGSGRARLCEPSSHAMPGSSAFGLRAAVWALRPFHAGAH